MLELLILLPPIPSSDYSSISPPHQAFILAVVWPLANLADYRTTSVGSSCEAIYYIVLSTKWAHSAPFLSLHSLSHFLAEFRRSSPAQTVLFPPTGLSPPTIALFTQPDTSSFCLLSWTPSVPAFSLGQSLLSSPAHTAFYLRL